MIYSTTFIYIYITNIDKKRRIENQEKYKRRDNQRDVDRINPPKRIKS